MYYVLLKIVLINFLYFSNKLCEDCKVEMSRLLLTFELINILALLDIDKTVSRARYSCSG